MNQSWYEVECAVSKELSGECGQWISETFGFEPVVIEMVDEDRARLVCYLDSENEAENLQAALHENPVFRNISMKACEPRDWETFWRTHFHVQEIGNSLAVVPSWETYNNVKRIALILDPGLSFGTGHHFTTRFCLEMIERLTAEKEEGTMWDLGAGSGILSIAAAKLGWSDIDAVDFDPQCIDAMQNNIKLNRIDTEKIHIHLFDITKDEPYRAYELVCANLYDRLLIESAEKIGASARKWLVLSGIQAHLLEQVETRFVACGFDVLHREKDCEWGGLCLQKKEGD